MAKKKSSPEPSQEARQSGDSQERPATKKEAVQQVLTDLGPDTKPLAIKAHLKERYGIDISADVASYYKKQLAKEARGEEADGKTEPAPQPQEATASEPDKPAAGQAETISKKEAVRRALKALGKGAMPVALRDWIKANLGIEMTASHVSTTKGELLQGKGKKRAAAPKARPKEEAVESGKEVPRPQAAPTPSKETAIPLHEILYVKGLVERFGPQPLHTLIDAFAK